MTIYKTEITSDDIPSDNPIHQRLLKPYVVISEWVNGELLELGCGEGRGVQLLAPKVDSYLAFDKIKIVVEKLQRSFPEVTFQQMIFPPLTGLKDNSFDNIVSFQVIEHIKNDELFLKEIYRVLKPGGKAYITTPNKLMSLTRNPWHIREYDDKELQKLAGQVFDYIEIKGIAGNQKVMQYYDKNKKSVDKILKYDILNLQYKLPSFLLKIPYEILNRLNRYNLKSANDELVLSISQKDYILNDTPEESLDLFAILVKK